jgi:hypothetical protein
MRQWREMVAKPPATLAECQTLSQALEQERAKAAALATPPKPGSESSFPLTKQNRPQARRLR